MNMARSNLRVRRHIYTHTLLLEADGLPAGTGVESFSTSLFFRFVGWLTLFCLSGGEGASCDTPHELEADGIGTPD
jgi:hypothetical protein